MQRALAYDAMPPLRVPLRFLLTVPCFAFAAALFLFCQGEAALASRWTGATLALTHLMTLGVLTMSMAGAMLQLLPVVAGRALASSARAGGVIWLCLTAGALMLAVAMAAGTPWLFGPAAVLLAGGCAVFALAAGRALLRPAPAGARPMLAGMRLALPAFAVAVALGAVLARYLGGGPAVPAVLLTDVHAGWGLLGWVAVLIVAVGFQVIPMFQSTALYPAAVERHLPRLLLAALAAWTWAAWSGREGWRQAVEAAAAAPLLVFACATLYLLQRRKRPADATTRYWRLSMASLLACIAVYFVPAVDETVRPLLAGVLFIAGFAASAVYGMLYKIVPFLLWYHLQAAGRLERPAMPTIRTLVPDAAAVRQFWWQAGALALLAGACLAPGMLARPAALAAAVAAGRLLRDLALPAWRYRLAF